MAQSKCPVCSETDFEVKETRMIRGSSLTWWFVQCAKCGAVVGVLDQVTHASILDRLGAIESRLSNR